MILQWICTQCGDQYARIEDSYEPLLRHYPKSGCCLTCIPQPYQSPGMTSYFYDIPAEPYQLSLLFYGELNLFLRRNPENDT